MRGNVNSAQAPTRPRCHLVCERKTLNERLTRRHKMTLTTTSTSSFPPGAHQRAITPALSNLVRPTFYRGLCEGVTQVMARDRKRALQQDDGGESTCVAVIGNRDALFQTVLSPIKEKI